MNSKIKMYKEIEAINEKEEKEVEEKISIFTIIFTIFHYVCMFVLAFFLLGATLYLIVNHPFIILLIYFIYYNIIKD